MRRPIELPTLGVGLVIYAGWLSSTYFHREIPLWLLWPLGGIVVAWHGSLQHEAVHGHPTRSPVFNLLFVAAPLSLWLPLLDYRRTHLAHHRTAVLTDPTGDPESFFVEPEVWARFGSLRRASWWIDATLLGRVVIGPALVVARYALAQTRSLRDRPTRTVWTWTVHAGACLPVLYWVVEVCQMSPGFYLAFYAYPGLSLTLLRSFAEHHPEGSHLERCAVVETGWFWSLLFLNNNLHALHHAEPGKPWYALPEIYRRRREAILQDNGGLVYRGYTDQVRRFALSPRLSPAHPRSLRQDASAVPRHSLRSTDESATRR